MKDLASGLAAAAVSPGRVRAGRMVPMAEKLRLPGSALAALPAAKVLPGLAL